MSFRLKNKLQYGSSEQEPAALARIQQLEEQLIDLDTENRDLKRKEERVKYNDREDQAMLAGPLNSTLRRSEDKNKYWELLGQIKTLETSEKELKERIEELKKEDVDSLVQV